MGRKKKHQRRKKHQGRKKEQAKRRPAAHGASDRKVSLPAPDDAGVARQRSALVRSALFTAPAALVILAALALWFRPERSGEFPRPAVSTAALARPGLEGFAGAESCEECHEEQYQTWLGSTHGKAGGSPSTETVIAPFDGTPIRFADAVVTPAVDSAGHYQFMVTEYGREPQVVTVAGVIGGGYMEGGGTQGFVAEASDGTVRFLPFDFIKREGVWFCNTNTRTDKGWIPITPDVSLAECADWPPVRILGTEANYANCQECHVAQIELVFDSSANIYSTRLTTLAIDCESCHGPMAVHVERSDPERIEEEEDIAVDALATLSKDKSLQICFQCHALKDVMQPGYSPGEPLLEYYSIGFPMLGGGPLHSDGRIRTFGYQGNHRYSDCYLNGSMTCVDCHDPHSQEYRDIWGRPLEGRFSDEQCTDCHPSKAERPEEHTFHEPGTDGSRCVDCHMPYLQHPELGEELRFARSDHTIPIPRPGADDRMGIVNACALSGCHPDSSVAALEAVTEEWYGELKPRKAIVEALLQFEGLDEARSVELLLDSGAGHLAAQIEAVGLFVTRFLWPDMPQLEVATERTLRRLVQSEDLDLKAAGLAALHLARGEGEQTKVFLVQALEASAEPEAALRARWATALGTFGDSYFGLGNWGRAIISYRKALEIRPGNAAILMNLGVAQAYSGDHTGAVASLRQSIAADSRQVLAWVNLGFSLESLGDTSGAEQAYRRAIGIKADEPLAHFNLGNVLLRRGDLRGAIERHERAVQLQPTLTQAYLYLVRAYVALDEVGRAVIVARRWQHFAPDDPRPRQLIQEVERVRRSR